MRGRVPALDGLRGIAIVLVVTGHAFGFPATSMGVDLFFVLSGFLITTLLIEGHYRGFRDFYAARVRRLVPALVAMLAVYVVGEAAVGKDGFEAAGVSLSYSANLFRAAGDDQALGALRHTWSLAMEEQFYLVWPVLLLVLMRRRVRPIIYLLVAAIVWYTIWPLWLQQHGDSEGHLLYAPDTRGIGLVVGCLAAVCREGFATVARFAIVPALALFALLQLGQTNLYAGGALTLFAFSSAVIVLHALNAGGVVARVLSARPLVWLGAISYALYLWHFPLLIWFGAYNTGPVWIRLAAIGIAVLAAYISGELVEKPFRKRARKNVELERRIERGQVAGAVV